jgi:hydroxyacylglutathione hydrolase
LVNFARTLSFVERYFASAWDMAYNSPHPDRQRRLLVIVRQLAVGPIQTNCYLVADEATAAAAVIDPGGDVEAILAAAGETGVDIQYVINTHAHFDHTAGNTDLIAATRAELAIHAADAPLLAQGGGADLFGIFGVSSPKPDLLLKEGDVLQFGETRLLVIHTPGHTPGGISLYVHSDGVVFCGDCLFYDGIGRTDLPGGDYDTLMASIARLLALPDETVIYPGHGPATTVEQEKENNPFVM